MRIELYNGDIVVAYKDEKENLSFIRDVSFDFLLGGWLPGFIGKRVVYDSHAVVAAAERHGVEVDAAVYDYLERKEAERRTKYEKEQQEKEKQNREGEWQSICKHGCPDRCKNLRRCGDDYICRVTDELLEIENKPKFYGGVYRLFNYRPMPSSQCPYNTNLNQEAV